MLRVELEPISSAARRTERSLWQAYREMLPTVLGGLVELASLVWQELPAARTGLTARPRMADFAELLWALDKVTGWDSLGTYLGEQDCLVDDVLDADPVASTLLSWARACQEAQPPGSTWAWHGSSEDLLRAITDHRGYDRTGDRWPQTGQVLLSRLTRSAPVLRKRGVEWSRWRTKHARGVDVCWTGPVLTVPSQSTQQEAFSVPA
jgi:hypothetical protein